MVCVLPTTNAQRRMWFLDHIVGASAAYHISTAVRLIGQLDRRALRQAMATVVRRHETLRTTFPSVDGQPMQAIASTARVAWPLVDLSLLAPKAQTAEMARLLGDQAQQRFNLARGPIFRTILIKLLTDLHVATVTIHHILVDGWSLNIVVREILIAYAAFAAQRSPQLPPLALQYGDYAVWHRQWCESSACQRELAYWVRQLSGAPDTPALPYDRDPSAPVGFEGHTLPLLLPDGVARRVRSLATEYHLSPFMICVAALAIVLARYTDGDEVVLGTPAANRDHSELASVVGLMVNTLALRIHTGGDATAADLFRRVRDTVLDAYEHQTVPFDMVVNALGVGSNLRRNPLFQVLVAYDTDALDASAVHLPHLRLDPYAIEVRVAQFDLELRVGEADGTVSGVLRYRTGLLEKATVARLAEHLTAVLRALVEHPLARLSDCALVDYDAWRELLAYDA